MIIISAFLPGMATFFAELVKTQEAELAFGGRDAFVAVLGAVVLLRGLLTFLIHWEIRHEEKALQKLTD